MDVTPYPTDWRVNFGPNFTLRAYFDDHAKAEQKAVDLHGIVTPLYAPAELSFKPVSTSAGG